ncbi:MAG: hypothetical protein RMK91_07045 [Pseudanabaenaceae cyanobacterium SKYGB_i_bin29]|nr:hypothetical protein [Pseudanabaenaceae cyanobacterium SKYG29]MDW8421609.1 hypothetical protein [Pseudanabaenaceae cyanobacterium SKYGB_i_bin29]
MIKRWIGLLLWSIGGLAWAQSVTIQDTKTEAQKALQEQVIDLSGSRSLNELIHRANLANRRSLQQFQADQEESFQEAVKAFRQQQRERLQKQP